MIGQNPANPAIGETTGEVTNSEDQFEDFQPTAQPNTPPIARQIAQPNETKQLKVHSNEESVSNEVSQKVHNLNKCVWYIRKHFLETTTPEECLQFVNGKDFCLLRELIEKLSSDGEHEDKCPKCGKIYSGALLEHLKTSKCRSELTN